MFKNKSIDGFNNISGKRISRYRKKLKLSQQALADELQLIGLDINKNAIQKIERGKGFVTDIELAYFAYFFNKSIEDIMTFSDKYIQSPSQAKKIAENKEEY